MKTLGRNALLGAVAGAIGTVAMTSLIKHAASALHPVR
jgi:hypothetical protein